MISASGPEVYVRQLPCECPLRAYIPVAELVLMLL